MIRTISDSQLDALRLGGVSHDALTHLPLLEEYRLVRLFGHGAMGRVYLAHDTLLNRSVAIKFLTLNHAHPAARERLLTEARALARLSHPNVVTIFRIGELKGHLFLVSEFIRGQSLDQLRKPVPWQEALEIGLGLARGLAAAHRRRILHRDIKPANAMLSQDGTIKLIDFGLAKLLGPERGAASPMQPTPPLPVEWEKLDQELEETVESSWSGGKAPAVAVARRAAAGSAAGLTQSGARLGTPRYMAPELWRGTGAMPSSDVYSLGAVLYELCSGRPPHTAELPNDLAHCVQQQDALPLSDRVPGLPAQLAEIVDRCLRGSPEERFSDGEALCLALERCYRPLPGIQAVTGNPYRGLQSFESEHSLLFFGRESESVLVLERLRTYPLLAVAGDSGVGKSSLCRAGVLPRLRAGELEPGRRWTIISVIPGRAPLRALATALSEVSDAAAGELLRELRTQPQEVCRHLERQLAERRGLVFFVDQLEELLTHSEPAEASDFAELLGMLTAIGCGVRVLLTVRADFLTRLLELPRLGEQLEQGLYLLRPLTRSGLHSAIVSPAEAAGYRFESVETIHTLLEDAQRTAGGLPLLQFTLSLLWDLRNPESRIIPASALAALGGFAGALSQYADGVLASLLPMQRAEARRLLPRLLTAEGMRQRRSARALLAVEPAAQKTLEALVKARLLVAREVDGDSSYELAHETLLSGWALLRELLDSDRDERALRERLAAAAAEWQRLDGVPDTLWGERLLAEAARTGVTPELLPEPSRSFFQESLRQHRKKRRNQLLRIGLVLGLPLLAAATLFQVRATRQARRAELEQRRIRESVELAEQGVRAANLAQSPGREGLALQTALHAAGPLLRRGETPPPPVLFGLSAAVDASRRSLPLRGHTGPLATAFFSPDGQQIVTASSDGTAKLFDGRTGALRHTLRGHAAALRMAVFSPDSQLVLTASEDGTARLWNAASGALLASCDGHIGPLSAAYFSPNGKLLLTASFTGRVAVWDVAQRHLLHHAEGFIGTTLTGNLLSYRTFSPDSRRLAIGRPDGGVEIRDARSGALLRTLPALRRTEGRQPTYAWYSEDGARLVTFATAEDDLVLWEPETGRRVAVLSGHRHPHLVNFTPDGRYLLTTGDEGAVRLWSPQTGAEVGQPIDVQFSQAALTISPDGRELLGAGQTSTARIWTLPGGRLVRELRGHTTAIFSAGYSPDGARAVTASLDGTARIWPLGAGLHVEQHTMGSHASLWRLLYTPDGRHVAVTEQTGLVHILNAQTGEEVFTVPGPAGNDGGPPCFSPDGAFLAASAEHQQEWIWDWRNRRVVGRLAGHSAAVAAVTFTRNGSRLVSGSYDRTLRIWDWHKEQELLRIGPLSDSVVGVEVSADGQSVVAATADGQVRVFSLPGGQPRFSLTEASSPEGRAIFSADGRRLLVGGLRPRVVDAWRGQIQLELQGHFDIVTDVSFSADERTILTASQDQTVRLWDARSGQLQHLLHFEDREYGSVQFSPDGQRILLLSISHNYVKGFPAQVADIWRMGCALLRNQPEWEAVQHDCPRDL